MLHYDDWGSHKTYPHMSVAWSWAFDTPFKWTKQVASHFGGTRQGLAISWPGHINDVGGIRTQFHHIIDIVPTILEAAGIQAPDDGRRHQAKADRRGEHGVHLRQGQCQCAFETRHAVFRDGRQSRHLSRRLDRGDHAARRAVGAWRPASLPDLETGYKWELYHIAKDYSEFNDLAARMPDKLKEMQALFMTEAAKYHVFPLDNSGFSRAADARVRAPRRARPISPISARTPAFLSAMRPASWTATTPSPPTITIPEAARRE